MTREEYQDWSGEDPREGEPCLCERCGGPGAMRSAYAHGLCDTCLELLQEAEEEVHA